MRVLLVPAKLVLKWLQHVGVNLK